MSILNGKQLFYALTHEDVTQEFFSGIFARDTLKDIDGSPGLLVCNTDKSSQGGSHWVVFFCDGDDVDFYDSLGRDIEDYGHEFVDFVNTFATRVHSVPFATQPPNSVLCGYYCLYYSFWRCCGHSMKRIVNSMMHVDSIVRFVDDVFCLLDYVPCPFVQCCTRCE